MIRKALDRLFRRDKGLPWFRGFPPLDAKLLRLHVSAATHHGAMQS